MPQSLHVPTSKVGRNQAQVPLLRCWALDCSHETCWPVSDGSFPVLHPCARIFALSGKFVLSRVSDLGFSPSPFLKRCASRYCGRSDPCSCNLAGTKTGGLGGRRATICFLSNCPLSRLSFLCEATYLGDGSLERTCKCIDKTKEAKEAMGMGAVGIFHVLKSPC